MIKPLLKLDIVISVFNQEEIIEKVLFGVFNNTTTPFNLILIFDGCTDRTKPRALKYLQRAKPELLRDLRIFDTPNLFELKANNFGFRRATEDYLITVQDDMVIKEKGWERRLTYPLRKFDDVLGVSARAALDVENISKGVEKYANQAARELGTQQRDIFAIRDVAIRGPFAFRRDYLKKLDYLNERYAPGNLDDIDLCLRAWNQYHWKVGSFWIDYISRQEWSKVNASDSTMNVWGENGSWRKNQVHIYEDHKKYIDSGIKHGQDIKIEESEIDYKEVKKSADILFHFKKPLRLDRRRLKTQARIKIRKTAECIKKPFIKLFEIILGKEFGRQAEEQGFKKAVKRLILRK